MTTQAVVGAARSRLVLQSALGGWGLLAAEGHGGFRDKRPIVDHIVFCATSSTERASPLRPRAQNAASWTYAASWTLRRRMICRVTSCCACWPTWAYLATRLSRFEAPSDAGHCSAANFWAGACGAPPGATGCLECRLCITACASAWQWTARGPCFWQRASAAEPQQAGGPLERGRGPARPPAGPYLCVTAFNLHGRHRHARRQDGAVGRGAGRCTRGCAGRAGAEGLGTVTEVQLSNGGKERDARPQADAHSHVRVSTSAQRFHSAGKSG